MGRPDEFSIMESSEQGIGPFVPHVTNIFNTDFQAIDEIDEDLEDAEDIFEPETAPRPPRKSYAPIMHLA